MEQFIGTHTANRVGLSPTTPKNADKVTLYKWKFKDKPGVFKQIPKLQLNIPTEYQREPLASKVSLITADFSWIAFGALVVALRDDAYWVIDGQHRLLAALRRSDIDKLPCIVFETESVEKEAQGFLDLNTKRKPVSSLARHRAMTAANDEVAVFVTKTLSDLGLEFSDMSKNVGTLKSAAWCARRAAENKDRFVKVLSLASDLSLAAEMAIQERLLEGLWHIDTHVEGGVDDRRLRGKITAAGARKLLDAAARASAYYTSGGARIWAIGMMNEINKGLRVRFVMRGEEPNSEA